MFSVLQVEEVRRHSHCLAFTSAGPQSQTYYVSYDSYTEHLRWHRTASKVLKVLHPGLCIWTLRSLCLHRQVIMFNFPRLHLMLSLPLYQIASQRVNSVDLSCCSLEELPAQLFYSQDLTHLNLKNNFMTLHKGVPALTR